MIPRIHVDFSLDEKGRAAFRDLQKKADNIYHQLQKNIDDNMLQKLGEELYDEYLHDAAWNQACEELEI